jgi:hypothetical protein
LVASNLLAFLVLGMTADATTSFLTCVVTETLPERRRRGRKPSTRRCSGPARRRVRACTTLGWTLTARARQAAPPPRRRAPSMINPIHHGVTERVGRGEKREPAARSRGRGRPCAARDVRVFLKKKQETCESAVGCVREHLEHSAIVAPGPGRSRLRQLPRDGALQRLGW